MRDLGVDLTGVDGAMPVTLVAPPASCPGNTGSPDNPVPPSLFPDTEMSVPSVANLEDELSHCNKLEDFIRGERGLPLVTRNGQRIVGPPENWQGPPPSKGSEVFVGKLPLDANEIELLPFLEQVGPVHLLRLMIDHQGHNRGFGFVTYADPETAQRAARELNQQYLRAHKRIAVVLSIDNRRLFFGGLPPSARAQDVLNEVTARVKNVTDVILYSCADDRARNRGFAFVEFVDHMSAAIARKELQHDEKNRMFIEMNGSGFKIQVDWAAPEPQADAQQMANVTNLFVRNVSVNVSEDELSDLFSLGGTLEVTRVRRPSNYAFIHFKRREDAEQAMTKLNGCTVDGLNLEVEWAKPPPRGAHIIFEGEHRYRSRPNKPAPRRHSSYFNPSPAPSRVSSTTPNQGRASPRLSRRPHHQHNNHNHRPHQKPIPYQTLASYPMQFPFSGVDPMFAPSAPTIPEPSHLSEVDIIAMHLFGCTPEYEALTCPMGDGQKQYYPCVNLAGQREIINVVFRDRESALDAAAAHCLARLQVTLQMCNMTRMPLAASRRAGAPGLASIEASLQALHLRNGGVHSPMAELLPPGQMAVFPMYAQPFDGVTSGMAGATMSTPRYHQFHAMG